MADESIVTPEGVEEASTPERSEEREPTAEELLRPAAAPLPGQQPTVDWQAQYYQLAQEYANIMDRLTTLEEAGLSEEEVAQRRLKREWETIEKQKQQLAELMYAQELYAFYSRFVPPEVIKGNTPSEWQDNVLSYLYNENRRLQEQLAKQRAAAKPGAGAPKVTSAGSSSPPARKSAWELTPEEREALLRRAKMGLITPEDYPGG